MTYVIGTAGHVDHGKSTLVEALTGIDPDRLAEEKEREMTIDLGFAWLTLPDGASIGIVDVPGHRDFIENMLAGVGGIDAALFVIAADEGVMPQTREHLAILDLLAVRGGVVALTKVDMVEDEDWLALVTAEVGEVLAGTVLESAPIVPVSARTGEGLEALLSALGEVLAERPPRPDLGRPRLPVDRVFSMSGFGTVVTGTLMDGTIVVGSEIEIQPSGRKARVRGAQSHKEKLEAVRPGSRVALNLAGLDVDDLQRGDVISLPGMLAGSKLVDAAFRHLPDAPRPLKHNAEVKLFIGAAEVLARVRLLGAEQLLPGEDGWLQLRLSDPVAVVRGDRFILRYPSPGVTVGGGTLVDPHPARRWRRFDPQVIERLATLASGTPEDVIRQALESAQEGLSPVELAEQTGLSREDVGATLTLLQESGQAFDLGGGRIFGAGAWERMVSGVQAILASYHAANPLKPGMPREELRSRLAMSGKGFAAAMDMALAAGSVAGEGVWLWLPDHEVRLSEAQQAQVDALLAQFAANPASPPSVKESLAAVGEDVYQVLLARGDLVAVSSDVVFDASAYNQMVEAVRSHLTTQESITVAQARDMFGTSRKYVLALLEHLDYAGVTRRIGDERVAGRAG